MLVSLVVLVLATVALAGACLAVDAYLRGARAVRERELRPQFAVVLAASLDHPLSSTLVRSVAVSGGFGPMAVCAAYPSLDTASESALREASGLIAPSRVHKVVGDPPARVFSDAWFAAKAVEALPDDVEVAIWLDPCARPAAHEVAPVAAAIASNDHLHAAAAIPVASPSGSGSAPFGRLVADLAPLLAAWYGPAGILPVCVATRRENLMRALQDPVSLNRLGPTSSLLMGLRRDQALLVPLPVGTGGRGSLSRVLFRHLAVLARAFLGRTLLFAMGLAALPLCLLALMVQGGPLCLAALAVAGAARATLAGTWVRAVRGAGPAVAGFLIAPLWDLSALAVVVWSMARRTVRSGGRLFRVRPGGILVPAGVESGE